MDEILKDADALGQRIGGHELYRRFREASQVVARDADAQSLLKSFEDHVARIQQLEMANRPIEPEDKRKLADLQARVAGHAAIKAMAAAHANYMELFARVHDAIERGIHGSGEE